MGSITAPRGSPNILGRPASHRKKKNPPGISAHRAVAEKEVSKKIAPQKVGISLRVHGMPRSLTFLRILLRFWRSLNSRDISIKVRRKFGFLAL